MQVLPADDPASIQNAVEVLQSGGVVAHATETCYGLACDIRNPEAVKKLFEAKERSWDMPVSALFSSVQEAKTYVEWNDRAEELSNEHLPGPLTIVLPIRSEYRETIYEVPDPSRRKERTLGIRVSPHPTARKLVTAFAGPLTTTSANRSGSESGYITPSIGNLVLDDGELPHNETSRVVVFTKNQEQWVR